MSSEFAIAGDFQETDFEVEQIISHARSAWDMYTSENPSPENENIFAAFINAYSMNFVMGKHVSALEAKLDEVVEALKGITNASN